MNIPSISIGASQHALAQAVSIRVMKMTNDVTTQASQDMAKLMEQSVQPNLGGKLDIKI